MSKFKIWATIVLLAFLIILTFLYISGNSQDEEPATQQTQEYQP